MAAAKKNPSSEKKHLLQAEAQVALARQQVKDLLAQRQTVYLQTEDLERKEIGGLRSAIHGLRKRRNGVQEQLAELAARADADGPMPDMRESRLKRLSFLRETHGGTVPLPLAPHLAKAKAEARAAAVEAADQAAHAPSLPTTPVAGAARHRESAGGTRGDWRRLSEVSGAVESAPVVHKWRTVNRLTESLREQKASQDKRMAALTGEHGALLRELEDLQLGSGKSKPSGEGDVGDEASVSIDVGESAGVDGGDDAGDLGGGGGDAAARQGNTRERMRRLEEALFKAEMRLAQAQRARAHLSDTSALVAAGVMHVATAAGSVALPAAALARGASELSLLPAAADAQADAPVSAAPAAAAVSAPGSPFESDDDEAAYDAVPETKHIRSLIPKLAVCEERLVALRDALSMDKNVDTLEVDDEQTIADRQSHLASAVTRGLRRNSFGAGGAGGSADVPRSAVAGSIILQDRHESAEGQAINSLVAATAGAVRVKVESTREARYNAAQKRVASELDEMAARAESRALEGGQGDGSTAALLAEALATKDSVDQLRRANVLAQTRQGKASDLGLAMMSVLSDLEAEANQVAPTVGKFADVSGGGVDEVLERGELKASAGLVVRREQRAKLVRDKRAKMIADGLL